MSKKGRKKKNNNFFVKQGKLQIGHVSLIVILITLIFLWRLDVYRITSLNARQTETSLSVNETRQAFITKIAPEAKVLQAQYGVRASISIAQAALESDWGKSTLASKYNNFFGVKASSGQNSITLQTSEYVNGKWKDVDASFRVYSSWKESMESHAKLLVSGTSENPNRYQAVITASNYENAANALYTGGYATDPDYPTKLIKMIQQYQLDQYDQ